MNRMLLLLFILTGWSTGAFAQDRADLTGVVKDERAAAITGAEMRLQSRAGLPLFARTHADGSYSFKNLKAGDYVLEVKATGFSIFTTEIHLENSATHDVTLSVEGVSESVSVIASGTAQRVDETSKSVTVLDNQVIEARRELMVPESLRGIPGIRVQQQGSIGALTTVRLRGLRNFDTAVLLDGLRVRDASDINGSAAVVKVQIDQQPHLLSGLLFLYLFAG